jgi:hypothetical protein
MAEFSTTIEEEEIEINPNYIGRVYADDGIDYESEFLENGIKLQAIGHIPLLEDGNKSFGDSGSVVYFGPYDDTNLLIRLALHNNKDFIFVDSFPDSYYNEKVGEKLNRFLLRFSGIVSLHEHNVTYDIIEEGVYYLFNISGDKKIHYFVNTYCENIENSPTLLSLLAETRIIWMQGYSPPIDVLKYMPQVDTIIACRGALVNENDDEIYDFNDNIELYLIEETEIDDKSGKYFYHLDIEENRDDDDEFDQEMRE